MLHQRPEYTGYLTPDTRLNLQKRGKQLKRLGKTARDDEFAHLRPSKVGTLRGSGRVENSLCCAWSAAVLRSSKIGMVWRQHKIDGALVAGAWPEAMSLSCCSPTRWGGASGDCNCRLAALL